MQRAVAEAVERTGLPEKAARAVDLVADLETAFGVIEIESHQFEAQPCPTCKVVSKLIDRPFGCFRLSRIAAATRSPTDGHAAEG